MTNLKAAVQKGIALLDEKIPDWLDKVGDLDTLDMADCKDCLVCRVTGIPEYVKAREAAGVSFGEGDNYGFSGPLHVYHRLTPIWREEIQKRLDQRGEKVEYPHTYHGSPARIIEENLVGRPGLVVIARRHDADSETIALIMRSELKKRSKIELKFGQRFYYHGAPRLITATPGNKALLINPDIGAWCEPVVTFKNATKATFTPEDFGLDPDKVKLA